MTLKDWWTRCSGRLSGDGQVWQCRSLCRSLHPCGETVDGSNNACYGWGLRIGGVENYLQCAANGGVFHVEHSGPTQPLTSPEVLSRTIAGIKNVPRGTVRRRSSERS